MGWVGGVVWVGGSEGGNGDGRGEATSAAVNEVSRQWVLGGWMEVASGGGGSGGSEGGEGGGRGGGDGGGERGGETAVRAAMAMWPEAWCT